MTQNIKIRVQRRYHNQYYDRKKKHRHSQYFMFWILMKTTDRNIHNYNLCCVRRYIMHSVDYVYLDPNCIMNSQV